MLHLLPSHRLPGHIIIKQRFINVLLCTLVGQVLGFHVAETLFDKTPNKEHEYASRSARVLSCRSWLSLLLRLAECIHK